MQHDTRMSICLNGPQHGFLMQGDVDILLALVLQYQFTTFFLIRSCNEADSFFRVDIQSKLKQHKVDTGNPLDLRSFFPTCQVRVVRFYVSTGPPSSSSSSFSSSCRPPQLRSCEFSVACWTPTAIL